ncbi:MAG: CPBP family intramembrane metalloprotease [Alphaproteobacteria bacterium]|nr:CPBP family intramembrane metalloprotease [Alphaproteobacteria bacterium]
MSDENEPFAASVRPILDGRDVINLALAVIGLTFVASVAVMLLYSIVVIIGIGGSVVLSGPMLMFIEAAGAFSALYFVLIRTRGFTWADLGWVPASSGLLILGGAAAIAVYGILISLALVVARFTENSTVDLISAATNLTPNSVSGFIAVLAFGAVAVPIAEEFLFRGVLFRWLKDGWGLYAGVVGSALVFAAVHILLGTSGALQIFLIGLALAYLYDITGSLWPSMVFHGVNNGISFIWIYLVMWSGAS